MAAKERAKKVRKVRTQHRKCNGVPVHIGGEGVTPRGWLHPRSLEVRAGCARERIGITSAHAGANIGALQNMLGHESAGLTLDRYGHLYGSDVEAVGVAINDH